MTSRPEAAPSPALPATERPGVPAADAPVVVLLHGLACERGQFHRQFTDLDPRLHLLAPDLPGHGEAADRCPPGTPPDVALLRDAVARDLDARGLGPAVVVGHSMGGSIALDLAVHRPDLVRGIVVLDGNMAMSDAALAAKRDALVAAEQAGLRAAFDAAMASAWGPDDGAAAADRAAVLATTRGCPDHVALPLWRDVMTRDTRPLWAALTVPGLFVRTLRDVDLDALAGLNPLATTLDLAPVTRGHWVQLQAPDAVRDAVEAFAARLAPSTEGAA